MLITTFNVSMQYKSYWEATVRYTEAVDEKVEFSPWFEQEDTSNFNSKAVSKRLGKTLRYRKEILHFFLFSN